MKERICSVCGVAKPIECFEIGRGKCIACRKAWQSEWSRNWRASGKAKVAVDKSNRTARARFAACRQNANRRGVICTLTFDEYCLLITQLCTYCQGPLNATGSGLDRKDSSEGYTTDNVTPCCWQCNRIKSNEFSYEEMLIIGPSVRRANRRKITRSMAKRDRTKPPPEQTLTDTPKRLSHDRPWWDVLVTTLRSPSAALRWTHSKRNKHNALAHKRPDLVINS